MDVRCRVRSWIDTGSWASRMLCGSCRRQLGRLSRDERGAVAVLLGIMIAVLLFMVAFAIDHSRFTSEAMQDSQALDAGLLAAATSYRKNPDDAEAVESAKSYYLANRPDGSKADVKSIDANGQTFEVAGSTAFGWKATLLRAFGIEEAKMSSDAKVKYGKIAEVVLVIDNSSLVSNHLDAFRTAGLGLKTELMGSGEDSPVKMGVVPFAAAVNVGANNRDAAWIDQNATVNFHRENYKAYKGSGVWAEATETRFELFDRLGEPWGGCVEARSGGYEDTDLAADPAIPDSLFVPMFAPDEPDPGRNKLAPAASQSYYNDYLEDYPQSDCPKEACVKSTKHGTCLQWATPNFTPAQWQQVSCKYAMGKTPNKTQVQLGGKNAPLVTYTSGPNFGCSSAAVQPLTRSSTLVENKLNEMVAKGGSNVAEGIMWGFRVLSPQVPFTGGSEFDDASVKKYMIVLARGGNWIEAYKDDLNHSIYTPWGYGVKDRLNPQSHTQQALTNAMDEKSRSACRFAAEKGVEVFTIGYQVSDPQLSSMLQYCAVKPKMYFEADTPDQLRDTLSTIASRITKLHLTQ